MFGFCLSDDLSICPNILCASFGAPKSLSALLFFRSYCKRLCPFLTRLSCKLVFKPSPVHGHTSLVAVVLTSGFDPLLDSCLSAVNDSQHLQLNSR